MKAAILTKLNAPLEVKEIFSPSTNLEYGQVLVEVLTSGICGAQLQDIRGEKGNEKYLPQVLGHEGCGIVKAVGPGVTQVKWGDKVVMHWRQGKGISAPLATYYHPDVGRISSGPVATFCTHSICSENRLTRVPPNTPPDLCALLGCGLSTALGTIEQEARVRWGESVLIVGVGGLGCNLILAAKLARANPIYTLDIHPGKQAVAEALGATNFGMFDTTEVEDWHGFDVIIETSGSTDAVDKTLPMLGPSGRYIQVGHFPPMRAVTVTNPNHLFGGEGKTIKATEGGGFQPSTDAPRYCRLAELGILDITGIITHRISLEHMNKGLDLVKSGEASRVIIDMSL